MTVRLERSVVDEVVDRLRWAGIVGDINRVEPGRYTGGATGLGEGSTDFVGVDPKQRGRAVYIEIKRSQKKSEHKTSLRRAAKQEAFRARMLAAGAVVGVAASGDEAVAIVETSRRARSA